MISLLLHDAAALGASRVAAWPDGAGRLSIRLELDRTTLAGRWFTDPDRASVEAEAGTTVRARTVLHPDGVDRALPQVGPAIRAGDRLVAHRVGRRAVLQLTDARAFRKVVRRGRAVGLETAARSVAGLPVRAPAFLDSDDTSVTVAALPGTSLHELASSGQLTADRMHTVGLAVARWHRAGRVQGLPTHPASAERAVTERWTALAADWGAPPGDASGPTPDPPEPPDRPVLLHRDLHDKQILLDPSDGEPGFIDFDLAAAGDPALDLANLIEHLWLRGRQGVALDPLACCAALLDGYRPDQRTRAALPFYRALTRRRLAAVYHFRGACP